MNGTMFRLPALVLLSALGLVALTGCHVTRPADPARRATASLPGPDAWPARDLDAVRGFHERTPEIIRYWELNGLIAEDQLEEKSREALSSIDRTVIDNRLTAHGLLRVWSLPENGPERFSVNWLFGGGFLENATFLTSRDASGYRLDRMLDDVPENLGEPRKKINFAVPGLQRTYVERAILLDRGTDVQIPETLRGNGLLVVMGGLFSTTWQESSIDLFRDAGWDLLQIDGSTSVRRPNDDEYTRVYDQQSEWVSQQVKARSGLVDEQGNNVAPDDEILDRFKENSSFENIKALNEQAKEKFPLPPSGFELTPDSDPNELGKTIAHAIDDTIAETAYAAAAAVGYLVETHGRDAIGPIGVVGYSAGSFAAPAVAARLIEEGHPVDAIILLGAGADLFEISQTSNITDGGIDLTGKGKHSPAPERIEAVHNAYLEHTALDPYALGPALADIPTLIMIADNDKPVPTGSILDERFGYPRRVRYFGGHGGLFYFLPPQTPRMIRWLDEVTQADE